MAPRRRLWYAEVEAADVRVHAWLAAPMKRYNSRKTSSSELLAWWPLYAARNERDGLVRRACRRGWAKKAASADGRLVARQNCTEARQLAGAGLSAARTAMTVRTESCPKPLN